MALRELKRTRRDFTAAVTAVAATLAVVLRSLLLQKEMASCWRGGSGCDSCAIAEAHQPAALAQFAQSVRPSLE